MMIDINYLFIYQILQVQTGGIARSELKKQVELSDFKFNQLLDELKVDLKTVNSDIEIDSKYVLSKNFSSYDYQLLQLVYFKRSVAADFLIKVGLFQSLSRSEFAEVHFMSEAAVYNLQADINGVISDFGLKIKSSKIVGEEENIRSFYFQLLFNYYGGIETPFPKRTEQITLEMVNKLIVNKKACLSSIQQTQLRIFLGIQINRIRNLNYINIQEKLHDEAKSFLEILQIGFSIRDIPAEEGEFLFLYLALNGDVKGELQLEKNYLEQKIDKYLEKVLQISQLVIYSKIKYEVSILAHKWSYFKMTKTVFISDEQLTFFKESYPFIHSVVYDFVDGLNKIDDYQVSEFEKHHLYFELMFCLLSFSEIKQRERPIKINVDFSGGKNYNSYISENIEYFRYLNIKLVQEMNDDVDIYISDFVNSLIACHQIIWRTPPVDKDWEEFANLVILLKGQKC